MIARRRLLGSTLVGGLFGSLAAPTAGAAADQGMDRSDRQTQQIVDALADIRKALDAPRTFVEIRTLRQKQTDFLRETGKFPDFIDVGVDVWFGVYDWHIKQRQPMVLGRDATGRHTIMLVATMLIMRPDMVVNYIGTPYENR